MSARKYSSATASVRPSGTAATASSRQTARSAAEPHADQPAREARTVIASVDGGAHGRARHDGGEAEVGRDHREQREPGSPTRPGRVGERAAAHLQPHLEDRGQRRGDEPIANGTAAISTAVRTSGPVGRQPARRRGERHDDGAEREPHRQRVADELGRPLRRPARLAHDDGDEPGVRQHAERLQQRQREREAAVAGGAEVARRDRDRDGAGRQDDDLAGRLRERVAGDDPARRPRRSALTGRRGVARRRAERERARPPGARAPASGGRAGAGGSGRAPTAS